jgi:hypothetical protein
VAPIARKEALGMNAIDRQPAIRSSGTPPRWSKIQQCNGRESQIYSKRNSKSHKDAAPAHVAMDPAYCSIDRSFLLRNRQRPATSYRLIYKTGPGMNEDYFFDGLITIEQARKYLEEEKAACYELVEKRLAELRTLIDDYASGNYTPEQFNKALGDDLLLWDRLKRGPDGVEDRWHRLSKSEQSSGFQR